MRAVSLMALSTLLSGVATAEFYRSPAVEACHEAVVASLAKNPVYDAFIPTEFLDDARILRWETAFSTTDPTTVATVVMLEGKARLLADRAKADEVTAKCGLNDNKVAVAIILKGHGLPDEAQ
jgi:hypothetical protein